MAKPRFEGLGVRVFSAVILAVVSLTLLWWGVLPFFAEVLLLALVGTSEYYDMAERKGFRPARRTGTLAACLLLVGATFVGEVEVSRLLTIIVMSTLIVFVMRMPRRISTLLDAGVTMLGVLYLGWMFSYLMLLRRLDGGAAWVTLLLVACAATDIGAYFVGKFFGRHKLIPTVSPKKTVEGSLGAVLCAVGALWLVGERWGMAPVHRVALGLLVAIGGQFGDLWESALKRDAGVKDSGDIIQGHGGVLDRFDSLAFAAPLFYLYLVSFLL